MNGEASGPTSRGVPTGKPASVLIIGSGPVVIGQAAEFDYAGTQACRALREEGIRTILLNSNPATIMTDPGVADAVYLEPLTVASVERILERERPEGILAGLGGQTALNLAMDVAHAGLLERYGVATPGHARSRPSRWPRTGSVFRDLLDRIGQPYAPVGDHPGRHGRGAPGGHRPRAAPRSGCRRSSGRRSRSAARAAASWTPRRRTGSACRAGLRLSPIGQVMVERCLVGWQEIEYEVMRDADDTCIAVCSMENVDPLGVHTGDSIVVAPVQTLPDPVHQRLRSAALAIIRALGVEGGCNVQFALSPDSADYAVIEVNPARQPLVGAGVQGHRLSHRARGGPDRHRPEAGRDPQRHHQDHGRRLRAGARLRGGQAAALPVRQVPGRRPLAGLAR